MSTIEPSAATLRSLVAEVYLPQNLRIRSDSTRKHYEILLKQFDEFLSRTTLVGDLNDATVAAFAHWLDNGARSAVTVNQRLHYLKAIATWCARRNLAPWLTIHKFPEPQRVPRAWSREQLERLLATCGLQVGWYCGIPRGLWWRAIHAIWWDTGERTAATLDLTWGMLDFGSGILDVPGEIRKGGCKSMTYMLKPATLGLLASIALPRRVKIFDFPGCIGTFYLHYGKLLEQAGLPNDRRSKPQKMRRSFASHLEAANGNATEALQHSARRVTLESYIDPSVVQREPPNRKLFDL